MEPPYRRKHDRDRPRSWFSLFLRLGGWASLIFGAVLILLTFISASQLAIADRLDREGDFTGATVMAKRVAEGRDSDGNATFTYYVTFRFKALGGGQEVERSTTGGFHDGVAKGDEVLIRYLRSDPTTLEYDIGQYRRAGDALRWVGLGMGVIGLTMLWVFGKRANAAVRVRRDGEKRFAEVTGIRELRLKVNRKRQARLLWREPDGQVGESFMHSLETLSERYKAGDKVVVFRLGRKAYWEGDVGPPYHALERD